MRTTIELQDALFREVKVVAAERGMSLKELFTVAIEQCIHAENSQGSRMTEPPVVLETAGNFLGTGNFLGNFLGTGKFFRGQAINL